MKNIAIVGMSGAGKGKIETIVNNLNKSKIVLPLLRGGAGLTDKVLILSSSTFYKLPLVVNCRYWYNRTDRDIRDLIYCNYN